MKEMKANIKELVKAARKFKADLKIRPTQEEEGKINISRSMAELVSGNFTGWELRFNESVFGYWDKDFLRGLHSVEIYRNNKLVGHRLLAPDASAEKVIAEISNAFLVAMEKVKEVERLKEARNRNALEKRPKAAVHGQS